MAILNQKRILNLIPKVSAPVTIHVSQGDVGTQIEFTLVKGDEVFVNPGNVTASVHGVREDGANFGPFTCTLSNSKVTFPLHSEMTAVKGSAIAEVVLVDNGGNKVGSANFGILVEESVFPLGVTYDNDVSVYESILAYVQSSAAQLTNDYTSRINAVQSNLNGEISARTSADALINTRIDEIIAPSGEAPSVAEVTDARVGADGVTYLALGDAIRTQFNNSARIIGALAATDDLDSITNTGIYRIGAPTFPSNYPSTNSGFVLVIRPRLSSDSLITMTTQIVMTITDQKIYKRMYFSGSWHEWEEVAYTDNIVSALLPTMEFKQVLVETDDLDDVKQTGIYRAISELPANMPVKTNSTIIVFRCRAYSDSNTNLTIQMAFSIVDGLPEIYYRAVVSGNWTQWIHITNSRGVDEYGTFGISINVANHNTQRISSAKGLKFGQTEDGINNLSDFDKAYPWCDIKECNIEFSGDTPVITYQSETGFSREKDTFIEIPKFYFKRTKDGANEKWLISGNKMAGFEVEPWFLDEHGNEVDKRYIAKYACPSFTGNKISVTGAIPQRLKTKVQFKTYFESAGFKLASIKAYIAIQHLMVIEYGTFDAKSINTGVSYYPYSSHDECVAIMSDDSNTIRLPYHIRNTYIDVGDTFYVANSFVDISEPRIVTAVDTDGATYVDISFSGDSFNIVSGTTRGFASAQPSGKTDSISNMNGRANGTKYTRSFKYRGIENIYGNVGEIMDDCSYNTSSERITVDDTMMPFVTPNNSTFISGDGTAAGFITELGYDSNNPCLTLPTKIGGTYSSPFYDEWSDFGSGDLDVVFSCGWDHWVGNGAFCMRGFSGSEWLYGARAQY